LLQCPSRLHRPIHDVKRYYESHDTNEERGSHPRSLVQRRTSATVAIPVPSAKSAKTQCSVSIDVSTRPAPNTNIPPNAGQAKHPAAVPRTAGHDSGFSCGRLSFLTVQCMTKAVDN